MYTIKGNFNNTPQIEGIEFAGYASVFNVIDKQNDVIEKGAFKETIKDFGNEYIALLFKHDISQKVGKITMLKEDNYGLYVEGIIDINLPKSEELIKDIEDKKMLHFSIGYYPKIINKKGNIKYVSKLDLIEISFVNSPANKDAQILNVEGIYTSDKILNFINFAKEYLKQL